MKKAFLMLIALVTINCYLNQYNVDNKKFNKGKQ